MTDANGNVTGYVYDQLNRLVKQTNPDGTVKSVSYNDIFSERTISDENGNLTYEKLSYDGLVETQVKQNTSGIQMVSYVYDGAGHFVETQISWDRLQRHHFLCLVKQRK